MNGNGEVGEVRGGAAETPSSFLERGEEGGGRQLLLPPSFERVNLTAVELPACVNGVQQVERLKRPRTRKGRGRSYYEMAQDTVSFPFPQSNQNAAASPSWTGTSCQRTMLNTIRRD